MTPVTGRPSRMPQWLAWSGALPFSRDDGRSAAWRVLGQRRFLGYFIGNVISNQGTWLQNTAQMLIAYRLTHSAFAVGVITCAQFSGFLVLGPWAATLADRLGSRRVLIGSQLFSAAIAGIMAILQFRGALSEQRLLIGALGTGLAFTFALPVQSAMVSRLVPPSDTKAAMTMNSVSYNIGRTVAPALCVAVMASIGAGWAFALNAVSFLVFVVVISAVHPHGTTRSARVTGDWYGLRVALWRPRILLLLAMVAAVTIADDPVSVLGPALAHQVLAVSSSWPAYFLSALGLGSVLGAAVRTKPSTARLAAVPLLVLAVSMIVFTAGFSTWLSFVASLAAGTAGLLTGAAAQALLLAQGGPQQAAQVMALWAIAWAGTKPLASLVDGWLGSHYGVRAGMLLAVPAFGIALLELFLSPHAKRKLKNRAHALAGAPAIQELR